MKNELMKAGQYSAPLSSRHGGMSIHKLLLVMSIGLAGCESVSEVVPTGKNTYMLTVKGCDGALLFGAPCATTGVKAANKFCEGKGLVASMAHYDVSQNFGVPEHGQVQFLCTDAEHQQPSVLRPDKGISTIQQ